MLSWRSRVKRHVQLPWMDKEIFWRLASVRLDGIRSKATIALNCRKTKQQGASFAQHGALVRCSSLQSEVVTYRHLIGVTRHSLTPSDRRRWRPPTSHHPAAVRATCDAPLHLVVEPFAVFLLCLHTNPVNCGKHEPHRSRPPSTKTTWSRSISRWNRSGKRAQSLASTRKGMLDSRTASSKSPN